MLLHMLRASSIWKMAYESSIFRVVLVKKIRVVEICFLCLLFCFFFQAEDGIRDLTVTGVQTCALPIWRCRRPGALAGGASEARSRPLEVSRRVAARANRRRARWLLQAPLSALVCDGGCGSDRTVVRQCCRSRPRDHSGREARRRDGLAGAARFNLPFHGVLANRQGGWPTA